MSLAVKICGLKDHLSVEAAVEAGAAYVGFVFYPPSPRAIDPADAGALLASLPQHVQSVGVVVDPDDALLDRVLEAAPLDILQLHGMETPERVAEIKTLTGRRVIKAIRVAQADDLQSIATFADCADMLMFDAKLPMRPDALPGGNGFAFDWRLLRGLESGPPWILSGGLNAGNLAEACACCRPDVVDVSSGVETAPGIKDPAKIHTFLNLAARLTPAGSA